MEPQKWVNPETPWHEEMELPSEKQCCQLEGALTAQFQIEGVHKESGTS